ncbi:MAG: type III pantothenate kinase, partial [Humidesulfovibrio sp.]|nr:type III pantothenate kinase [Humidesulfovibrio sp.]
MDTVLLLDVGNTNVKIGLAQPGRGQLSTYALPTAPAGRPGTADSWGLRLLEICRVEGVDPGEIVDIVASSVAPPMNPVLTRAAARFFGQPGQRIRFVPADIPLSIENRYARPQEVGSDRLVTAYGARAACPAHTLIVVDFGTATTFDCVQGNAYLGGLICPGVLSSAQALATGTAKLPHISLEMDYANGCCLHIGRSTAESLNQGLLFGFAAMV